MIATPDVIERIELNFDQEPACEARHNPRNTLMCSVEVVAKYSSCQRGGILVCQRVVDFTELHGNEPCGMLCTNTVADCWRIIPI